MERSIDYHLGRIDAVGTRENLEDAAELLEQKAAEIRSRLEELPDNEGENAAPLPDSATDSEEIPENDAARKSAARFPGFYQDNRCGYGNCNMSRSVKSKEPDEINRKRVIYRRKRISSPSKCTANRK